VIDHLAVEIITAQISVPSRGLDFTFSIFNGKDGDMKCTTTEVKNKDVSFFMTLQKLNIG
jgi:hypothetical protein